MSDIDVLAWMADDWLHLQAVNGFSAPRNEDVRRVLTRVARAAPVTAAAACPRLMRFIGPQAAVEVNALVTALNASAFDAASPRQAPSKVSVKEAAELMHVTPQAVRLAAAKGKVTASKRNGEWRIDRASAEQYRRQACP